MSKYILYIISIYNMSKYISLYTYMYNINIQYVKTILIAYSKQLSNAGIQSKSPKTQFLAVLH